MIIVEGPDGAGKSTLVESLSKEFALEVGERGVADRSKLYTVTRQDTYTALSEAVKGNELPQIWDRLFFSELVYAPMAERKPEFSEEESITIKRVMQALGIPIIVCLPPFKVVEKNIEDTEQMSGVHKNIGAIWQHYTGLFTSMPWVMWYDYTQTHDGPGHKTYDEILESLQYYLEDRKKREW